LFKIFIDADSFPRQAREAVIFYAENKKIPTMIVANRPISVENTEGFVTMVLTAAGKDASDHYITGHVAAGDIVFTLDLLLAEQLIKQNIYVMNHLGVLFSGENIVSRLIERRMMLNLAEADKNLRGKGKTYGANELKIFKNALEQLLQRKQRF
jgi:uncharacterized protein YaiI (UPF0178 family)